MQQQTIQMEAQAKMAVIQKEKELESQMLMMKLQMEAQIEQMKMSGKMDMSKIEADSREYIAEIKKSAIKMSDYKK